MLENVPTELTRKQETFIAAMLSMPTIMAAAQHVQVTDKTAHAWLKLPHVQEAYQQARKEAFDKSLQVLMTGTSSALSTILSIMKDSENSPGVRLRAAQIWLEKAIEVHKNEDLEARIQELEEAVRDRA